MEGGGGEEAPVAQLSRTTIVREKTSCSIERLEELVNVARRVKESR